MSFGNSIRVNILFVDFIIKFHSQKKNGKESSSWNLLSDMNTTNAPEPQSLGVMVPVKIQDEQYLLVTSGQQKYYGVVAIIYQTYAFHLSSKSWNTVSTQPPFNDQGCSRFLKDKILALSFFLK